MPEEVIGTRNVVAKGERGEFVDDRIQLEHPIKREQD